jgi:hypothetical protein
MAPVTQPKDAAVSKNDVVSKNDAVSKDDVPSGDASKNSDVSKSLASDVLERAPGSAPAERVSRGVFLLIAAASGAAVGTIGSFGHRTTDTWLGVSWPIGLALCFGGLIGLLLGIGELLVAGAPDSWRPTRLSALGCASAGWLLALLWITYLGPPPSFARKGDVVLANDGKSLGYLLGGMFVITVTVYRAWVATLSARLANRPGAPGSGHSNG